MVGLRVIVSKGGCSGMTYKVSLSEKKEGDEVIKNKSFN